MLKPEWENFSKRVLEYCRWAEATPDAEKDLAMALRILPALYAGAVELPHAEPSGDLYSNVSTRQQPLEIHKRFASMPFQYYWVISDPTLDEPEEPVCGDLCDDLTDIYFDLKKGLQMFEAGQIENAVFHWKTTFGFHWGSHAISALHALHLSL